VSGSRLGTEAPHSAAPWPIFHGNVVSMSMRSQSTGIEPPRNKNCNLLFFGRILFLAPANSTSVEIVMMKGIYDVDKKSQM
jgi:hypothetical protein